MKTKKTKKAFSLIEISIVVLIIGLLIAGISKATDMIFDAELKTSKAITKGSKINRMPNLVFWLETSLSESIKDTLRIDGGDVTEWRDINPQSTSKLFFKNTGAPKYLEKGFNNLPAIRLTSTDNFLPRLTDTSSTVSVVNSGSVFSGAYTTIFAVVKPVASAEIINFCEYPASVFTCAVGKEIKLSFDATGKLSFSFPNGAATASILSSSVQTSRQAIIVSALKDTAGNKIFVDGANAQATAVANTSATITPFDGTFRIGTGASNDLYEIIVFSTNLSDTDRQTVEEYLAKKYNIKVAKTAS